MASWWKPWTWRPGGSHADNFIRNQPQGWQEGARRIGLPIDETTALQLAAVFCAVRVIAEGISQVPLKVYRETERDGKTYREPARDHNLYRILHRAPNGWMTSFEWRETMTMHAVLTGNAFSIIARVNGEIDELIPVHPSQVDLALERGQLRYRVTIEGRPRDIPAEDMFHLRGPSMDGIAGLPVVQLAREVLRLTAGLEKQQSDLQDKNARADGILANTTTSLSDTAKVSLKEEWQKKFGPNGSGGIAVLDGPWTYEAMTMTAVDAQHIESRKLQIEEIGRAFRVLPLMLMQSDKTATFASSEQFFIAHVVHTLEPWVQRWENAIDRDLIEDDDLYAHFLMQGLMRGAAKDRAEYYTKALGSGGAPAWHTQNEIRAMEDLDPLPDGDELFRGSQNEKTDEGGGPEAAGPFDEAKAYRASQPRGADGRWVSIGARLAELLGAAGMSGKPLVMSLGRVRRPGVIGKLLGEPVSGFRYTLSNQAIKHARARHPNLTKADFEALPAILRDARKVRLGKPGRMGGKRVEIVHRHAGTTYGVIAQHSRKRRWMSVVTFYRM